MSSVSAVIPCYNGEAYLAEAIESVLRQTRPVDEIIVVDDGSKDRSVEVARSFGARVRVIEQPNSGPSAARNAGIDAATGDWVALLDADDMWLPHKIERQLEAAAGAPDAVCILSNLRHHGLKDDLYPYAPMLADPAAYTVSTLIVHCLVHPSVSFVRRSVPVRFPTWTRRAEDLIYFAELRMHGRFVYVDEVLALYRLHPSQNTRNFIRQDLVQHHVARVQWLETMRARIGEEEYARAIQGLIAELTDWCRSHLHHRDWTRYRQIRAELEAWAAQGYSIPFLSERVYPPFVYWLWDRVKAVSPVARALKQAWVA